MKCSPKVSGMLVCISLLATATTAGAERSPVPAKPHIVDVGGDANHLYLVDQPTPVTRPEADLLAAWFSSDGKNLTAHWHVAASPVEGDVTFSIRVDPAPDDPYAATRNAKRCFIFAVVFPAPDDPWSPYAHAGRRCADVILDIPTKPQFRTLTDGSFVVSTTYAMSGQFPFRRGHQLSAPYATAGVFTVIPNNGYEGVPRIDSTPTGLDYRIP